MQLSHTPVDKVTIAGFDVFVKRDDQLHPAFSGNKARKFAYFLAQPYTQVSKLVGYGSPQANSLYSMAVLAKMRGWQLDFYVDHIAKQILKQPAGNYAAAIAHGANVIDLSQQDDRNDLSTRDYIERHVAGDDTVLYVPEGGRCEYAEYGLFQLAREIVDWKQQQQLSQLNVFLPSGTGTTALFLTRSFAQLDESIKVLTCAVVGGDDYLTSQFYELSSDCNDHPQIITPPKRYHFGKLYHEFYQHWLELNQSGIEFELLYDPLGWMMCKQYLQQSSDEPMLYLHQGGLLGNETMLPRYKRKFDGN
ncbi:pyridoxal-phosphate dependent enzyme [Shewanella sp. Scap07]|uniref:pyridoxal-phosphate dependent enzyme n=1 Tax=Shewanella sp. Scap07 TaxID=2589987 RepID=UPI0015BF45FF|nr:pyridoxal-phosphate dependent enzyme [Shewanella sp. Scap07]QLE85320.1 pyridoxal-phosphate dependent enzyme [Shewanella sp. Scap07]